MRPLGPGHCLRWHSQEEVELKFKSRLIPESLTLTTPAVRGQRPRGRLYMVCQGKEAFKKGVKSE